MYVVLRVDKSGAYVQGQIDSLDQVPSLGSGQFALYAQSKTTNAFDVPTQFTFLKVFPWF